MAGGHTSLERCRAAAGLYHTKRVPRIIILDEQTSAAYLKIDRAALKIDPADMFVRQVLDWQATVHRRVSRGSVAEVAQFAAGKPSKATLERRASVGHRHAAQPGVDALSSQFALGNRLDDELVGPDRVASGKDLGAAGHTRCGLYSNPARCRFNACDLHPRRTAMACRE